MISLFFLCDISKTNTRKKKKLLEKQTVKRPPGAASDVISSVDQSRLPSVSPQFKWHCPLFFPKTNCLPPSSVCQFLSCIRTFCRHICRKYLQQTKVMYFVTQLPIGLVKQLCAMCIYIHLNLNLEIYYYYYIKILFMTWHSWCQNAKQRCYCPQYLMIVWLLLLLNNNGIYV